MTKAMVIYKEGEINLQTGVTNGICDYTTMTVREYLERKGPKYSCISFDDALDKIAEVENKKLIPKKWHKTSKSRWWENLEVLPPEKWQKVKGVEFFRMSEYYTSNITNHFARVTKTDGKELFFEANRRTSDSYDKLAVEVLSQI